MKRKTNKKIIQQTPTDVEVLTTMTQTNRDLVAAILIVSLLVNLFVLIGWVTLKVTTVYDAQISTFLFTR